MSLVLYSSEVYLGVSTRSCRSKWPTKRSRRIGVLGRDRPHRPDSDEFDVVMVRLIKSGRQHTHCGFWKGLLLDKSFWDKLGRCSKVESRKVAVGGGGGNY